MSFYDNFVPVLDVCVARVLPKSKGVWDGIVLSASQDCVQEVIHTRTLGGTVRVDVKKRKP